MKPRTIFDVIPFFVSATMFGLGITNIVVHLPQGSTWILAGTWVLVHEVLRRKWDRRAPP